MRGTEISATASDAQDQGQRDGAQGLPGGGGLDGAHDVIVGPLYIAQGCSESTDLGDRRTRQLYVIYALVDPRDGRVFYIGFTGNHPRHRLNEHRHNRTSAAWDTIKAIEDGGGAVGMCVLATFEDRNDALAAELHYIATTPGLVNRQSYSSEWFPAEFVDRWSVEPDLDFVAYEEDMAQRLAKAKQPKP